MFDKILIANRGEIACRVIKTCRRLGIRTVAVCSDADLDALHVELADEVVRLGPPPAAESYLKIEAIVDACRQTGAQAVHPGYGFLSERAAFAEALSAAGITFIGPPAAAIRAMGDKIESKRLARAAGVSTVPGTLDSIADPDEARRIAREIGYPVMIKASAGGGGKGMRIARDERELLDGLARARSEARSAFGDERVFLEKFVEEPRHIEIQVLGDKHGTIVYLGERECSIQRRHQKVIEEAPSPFLDKATRQAMGEQAVALARAVGYYSAGTVEFIVDRHRNFYFLEMNTRLQVEHPVTELVTGLDLVELMIKVAAGEPLPFRQEDVRLEGWAVEARVYAEDPSRGFLPSVGRLVRYREPTGKEIRIDSGVYEGGEVSIHYDPMIAKLCARGHDRRGAIAAAREALDAFVIRGPVHNIGFLSALLGHPRFLEGRLSTAFIAEEFGERFRGVELPPARLEEIAAVVVRMRLDKARRDARASGKMPGWRYRPEPRWVVQLGGVCLPVTVLADDDEQSVVHIVDRHLEVAADWRPGDPVVRARVTGASFTIQADPLPEGWLIRHGGAELPTLVRTRRAAELAARIPEKAPADSGKMLRSPMPGLIVSVAVQPGDEVKAGQDLCILEAMKMENVLRAERDGRVEEVRVRPRDTVAADQVLITFA
ncbi:MAG: acetyl/propionyl/methylcrotonyl-CoA carboxylase subunit alpha [Geminicoccaceae bacterium]|nr:acetyl/propionyl/methylcrotonyl-CoA carboxylase subunit alpha [Geminicoccaceae bacterium]MCX8100201.1 acetyl/propionyl/methylcrotonyl-CoA carboxylase subunit alpha [Geminicoccaceae bacterium]MDW8371655.1 acetyl/propionyl/methylcrotonyl-CoA carboxylase subunit alpha [Geminicoccaceae bacterium]